MMFIHTASFDRAKNERADFPQTGNFYPLARSSVNNQSKPGSYVAKLPSDGKIHIHYALQQFLSGCVIKSLTGK